MSDPFEGRPVIGYVERLSDSVLSGWAYDRADPASRPEVRVCLDGVVTLIGIAEEERLDLADAGDGDGHYGFRVPLPRSAEWRDAQRITVRAGPSHAETELPWPNRGRVLPEPPEEDLPVPAAFPAMDPAYREALFTLLLHGEQLAGSLSAPELVAFAGINRGTGLLETLLQRLASLGEPMKF